MKRYDKYKDSGIAWIGNIPEHWEVRKIKQVASCNDEALTENTPPDTSLKYVEISDVNASEGITNLTEYEFSKAPSRARRVTKVDDIIISTVRTYLKAIARVNEPELIVSTGFAVLRAKNINALYLSYTAQSSRFLDTVVANSTGVNYPAITANKLISLSLPLPPKAEQEAIVKYLDEKTEQINQYITLQEQQIQGLQELKQSIIARAVTRGLDPKAPLRPSGIAWIGDIPCHWQKLRCKDVLIENKELVGKDSDKYTLLSLSTRGVIIRDLSEGKGKFPKDFSTYKIVSPDNLVFCLFDVDETPRTVGYSQHKGMITGAYNIFSVKNTNISFLYHLFLSFDNRKSLKPLYKGLRKVIPLPSFMSMPIFLPPLEEQEAIVKYLDEKTEQINLLISKTEASIARMKEFKQSLIADAVTGRFKVPTLK